jgi:hypothetical protein
MANALGKFFGLTTMGDPSAGRPARDIRDSRRWFILAVLGVAQLMVVLDTTVVNIALPSAQLALHFSNDQRQWIVTAYSLAFGGLVLLGGKLADIFGRKSTLIVGLAGICACLSGRRSCAVLRDARRRARRTGRLRRAARAIDLVASQHDLRPALRAQPGVRCLRRHRR